MSETPTRVEKMQSLRAEIASSMPTNKPPVSNVLISETVDKWSKASSIKERNEVLQGLFQAATPSEGESGLVNERSIGEKDVSYNSEEGDEVLAVMKPPAYPPGEVIRESSGDSEYNATVMELHYSDSAEPMKEELSMNVVGTSVAESEGRTESTDSIGATETYHFPIGGKTTLKRQSSGIAALMRLTLNETDSHLAHLLTYICVSVQ
jgi:hypothetical protein